MKYDPQHGDLVLRRALEGGEGFGDLARFVDAGWSADALLPLLSSPDESHCIGAAFVLSEAAPASVASFVSPVAQLISGAPTLARHDLLDYLIRQPRSPVRDAAVAGALADPNPVIARNATQEVCRWPERLNLEGWQHLLATAHPMPGAGRSLEPRKIRRVSLLLSAAAAVRDAVPAAEIATNGDESVRKFVEDYARGWSPRRVGRSKRD